MKISTLDIYNTEATIDAVKALKLRILRKREKVQSLGVDYLLSASSFQNKTDRYGAEAPCGGYFKM